MRVFLILLASFLAFTVSAKEVKMVEYDWRVTKVVDGDTIKFEAPWVPDPIKKEMSVRIYGVDTPEKGWRGKCEKEKAAGAAATKFAKDLVKNAKSIKIAISAWDKFGGRVLGDVIVDGKSLRKELIANGHAREYYGEKKQSWCD
jgi:endonuclease YncB( thermonuclease family)